jgi:N-acetylneuraminic acid mutarotase
MAAMSRGDRWARGSLRSALAAFACLAALGAAQGATFDTVGSLPTGEERFGHNAILLQDGRLALFFGKRGSDSSFSTEVLTYHPTTGEWTAADFDAPPASEARFGATVTMLQNGRILFTGGRGHTGDLATAGDYLHTTVQFDPRASPGSQWTSAGSSPSMAERRIRHTATLLPDGKLLIAGGLGCSAATVPCGPSQASSLASAEIYDPDGGGGATMGSFSPTSSMSSSRFDHAAVLVPATGNVRIFGGFTGALTINASPAVIGTGSQAISYWPLDEGAAGNGISVAQICSSGSAVVTVFEPGVSDEVDVLIPGIGTFPCTITATVAEVATAVSLQSAVLWASTDGTTENPVEGSASTGTDGQGPPSALAGTERYNVGTGIWEAGLSLPDATGMDVVERAAMTATLLPGVPHRIAIVGGTADEISPISSVVVYTAAADLDDSVTVYAEYAAGYQARWQHTANLLPNGQLLVAGGNAAGFTTSSSVQILSFDTVTDQYTVEATEAAVRRTGHTGVILDTGAVVLAGGWVPEFIGAARDTTTTEVYDPSDLTLALEILSVITEPLAASSAILLPNGKVLVAFGDTGGGVTSNGYLFDPATNTWAAAHDHIGGTARRDAPVLPWDDGALVIGGAGPSNALTSVRRFDVASNSWSGLTSLLTARREHTATLLTDGSILVTGGANISDPALSTCEIYYPSADVWAGTGLNMLTARRGHTATLLKDGRVVLFGGFDATGTALNSIEVFEPGFGFTAITPTGTPPAARGRHSAVLLGDGRILVAFGSNGTSSLYSAAIFDPDAEAWSAAASAIETHGPGHKTTLLPSGQVLALGGPDRGGPRRRADPARRGPGRKRRRAKRGLRLRPGPGAGRRARAEHHRTHRKWQRRHRRRPGRPRLHLHRYRHSARALRSQRRQLQPALVRRLPAAEVPPGLGPPDLHAADHRLQLERHQRDRRAARSDGGRLLPPPGRQRRGPVGRQDRRHRVPGLGRGLGGQVRLARSRDRRAAAHLHHRRHQRRPRRGHERRRQRQATGGCELLERDGQRLGLWLRDR